MSQNPESQGFLSRLGALLERTREVQFVVPEDTGWFSLEDDLVDQVMAIMEESIALYREIERVYDERGADRPEEIESSEDFTDFLKEIGAQISTELASREVADVAFAGRNQVIEARDALRRARGQKSIWKIASHVDTGLRRIGKGLIAVEGAMREFEGLEPIQREWESLEDSLEIRRTYGLFRRAVQRGGDPRGEDLIVQLKDAARRIATLRDLKIYPYLRIDDRLQIRQLQKRILRWLGDEAAHGSAEHEAEGRRLWSDLVGFSRLLSQINNREELREHDRRVVLEAVHRLYNRRPAPHTVPSEVLDRLEPMLGRDEELDLLLLDPQGKSPEDWRDPLLRLQRQLEKASSPAGIAEPPF